MKFQDMQPQLSLDHPVLGPELARLLADGTCPEELIYQAYRITLARLSNPAGRIKNPRAFFRGVLRRLVLRPVSSGKKDGQDAKLRRLLKERLLINSVVEDMRRAGYRGEEIFSRIIRDYGEKINPELIRLYQSMLLGPARGSTKLAEVHRPDWSGAGGKDRARRAG